MEFFPNDPLDESAPQAAVWEAVVCAFKEEEGVGYYRYPVYDKKSAHLHEIDILLVLRKYGVFLLEVKGYTIANIAGIQGQQWLTRNWYTSEEYPVNQVINQSFALKKWLDELPEIKGTPYIHHAVALPFVLSEEWERANWHKLPTTGCARTKEMLSPAALQKWVRATGAYFQSLIHENNWRMLKESLGRMTVPTGDIVEKTPLLLRYNGSPPSAAQIREELNLPRDGQEGADSYFYVVATSFLEALRGGGNGQLAPDFVPSKQVKELRDEETGTTTGNPQLLFDNALKHLLQPWLSRRGMRLADKAMERLYLSEAIKQVAKGNEVLIGQLQHDLFTWRKVLGLLDEEGVDLATADLKAFALRLAQPDPKMVALIADLQKAYHASFAEGEIPYEKAARMFIKQALPKVPVVVMEGFSFFRPLQVYFAERCHQLGAQVVFLHPFRPEQEFGFHVLQRTYGAVQSPMFQSATVTNLETNFPLETDLDVLRHFLFANQSSDLQAKGDGSVTVEAFPHRHDEVRSCVERIVHLLRQRNDKGERKYEPYDIRIVTTDPETYRALLLEEVEMYRQQQLMNGETDVLKPGLLRVPPRQLLLTPLGRFILTLYNVWNTEGGGKLNMTADQFVTFLSSGLLSVPSAGLLSYQIQQSAKRFIACKDQVFARCRNKHEWFEALQSLEKLRRLPKEYHLPTSSLLQEDASTWINVLKLIVALCEKLFNTPATSIAGHIQNLRERLNIFDPIGMNEKEQELLKRIQDVLLELEARKTVAISTEQFREVINLMVADQKEEEDGWANQIAVISPEGLDSSRQPIVFFLGADSNRLPRPYREPWPFYDINLSADMEQDRYLFLAAVRATLGTAEKPPYFFVSYARADNRQELQPSAYFQEVMTLLSIEDANVYPGRQVLGRNLASEMLAEVAPYRRSHDRDYERDPYTFSELLHYELCPYRYQLERLDPQGDRYITNFQLRYLAKGIWLHLVLSHWQAEKNVQGIVQITRFAKALRERTEAEMKEIFRGFAFHDWEEVKRNVDNDLPHLLPSTIFDTDKLEFHRMPKLYLPLPEVHGGQRVLLDIDFARKLARWYKAYPSIIDARNLRWLAYGKKPADFGQNTMNTVQQVTQYYMVKKWDNYVELIGSYLLTDNKKAEQATLDAIVAVQQDLSNIIAKIKTGHFPKNPGEHCSYCPSYTTCLGGELQ